MTTAPKITVTIDGKPITATSISLDINTIALPAPGPLPNLPAPAVVTPATVTMTVAPNSPFTTIAAAARSAPDGATILIAPGFYKEALAFDRPITVQSASWKPGLPAPASGGPRPTVVIDATGLALPENKSALLFRAPGIVRGIEITGAVSPDDNGAGIRNYPGIDITIADSDVHDNQMGIMVDGGVLTVLRTNSHHPTGDGNCHPLYYAHADAAGHLVAIDSRFYHCRKGNSFKTRAVDTQVTRCWFGSISVPASMSGLLPGWGGMNPPPPDSNLGGAGARVWLGDHIGCNCGGQGEAGKCIDIPDGGRFTATDCVILKGGIESEVIIGYCFETTKNGVFDTLIQRTLISKQCRTIMGNRGPGSTMTFLDCPVVGDTAPDGYKWGQKPWEHDLGNGITPAPVIKLAGTTPPGA